MAPGGKRVSALQCCGPYGLPKLNGWAHTHAEYGSSSASYKGEKKKREPETGRGDSGVWEKSSREGMIKIHCIHE